MADVVTVRPGDTLTRILAAQRGSAPASSTAGWTKCADATPTSAT
jgi:hypothetical protein